MADERNTGLTPRMQDLTGQSFGCWTVIEFSTKDSRGYSRWKCRCACGRENIFAINNLKRKRGANCIRCRAKHKRRRSPNPKSIKLHGKSNSPTYNSWAMMKQRCNNRNATGYRIYGGRGIRVCGRWNDSFEAFLQDMGERPSLKHSIDRYPDNDGNYEPSNCRWATRKQQQRNTGLANPIVHDGEECSVAEWSRRLGISTSCLSVRISRRGQTIADVIADGYTLGPRTDGGN